MVPCEFIGVVKSQQSVYLKGELVSNHDELMCNFFAQVGRAAQRAVSATIAAAAAAASPPMLLPLLLSLPPPPPCSILAYAGLTTPDMLSSLPGCCVHHLGALVVGAPLTLPTTTTHVCLACRRTRWQSERTAPRCVLRACRSTSSLTRPSAVGGGHARIALLLLLRWRVGALARYAAAAMCRCGAVSQRPRLC